jgi:hypothetical protein
MSFAPEKREIDRAKKRFVRIITAQNRRVKNLPIHRERYPSIAVDYWRLRLPAGFAEEIVVRTSIRPP